jgi:serpin B
MKTIMLLFLFLVLLFQTKCNLPEDNENKEPEITKKTAALIKAGNEFSFDLFQNIYISDKKSDNIMVSPLSVSLALAMTYNGAAGKTKSDMEKTLRVYGLSPEDINSSYHDLVEALKELDEKVFLRIANAIYYRENFEVEKSFIATNKQY